MEKIWAVEPNYLVEYLETTLNLGDDFKDKSAAFFGDISSKDQEIFSISGDTATININGILSQDGPSPIARFFGFNGTGYTEILHAIAEIQKNEDIKTVRLAMNTPGGQVDGVDRVFQAVQELGQSKNVIAESHGLIASAGYWIASAANKIIATSPADQIGSIGVVVVAIDFSKNDKEHGIEVIVIRSANAPDKIPDPGTDKGKLVIQERVNAIERVFIGRISEGRGVPVKTIEKDFARGSVLVAEDPDKEKSDALSVGMIDSVDSPVAPVVAKGDHKKGRSQDNPPITAQKKKEEKAMNLQEAMADGGLRIEIESRDRENIKKGTEEAKAEYSARIEKCKKFLISSEYPEVVKNLAINVMNGNSEFSALEGAVTVIDAQKEAAKAADAKKETGGQKETPPGAQDGGTVEEGTCQTNAEFDEFMKKDKK